MKRILVSLSIASLLIIAGFGVNYAVTTQDGTQTEEVASIDKEKKGKKNKKGKAGCCAGAKAESCSKAKAAGCCAGKTSKKES